VSDGRDEDREVRPLSANNRDKNRDRTTVGGQPKHSTIMISAVC
jgi:hypothetical protein